MRVHSCHSFARPLDVSRERSCVCILVCRCFARAALAQQDLVTDIVIHGNRRIPADTVKARIFTKAGDVYDPAASRA